MERPWYWELGVISRMNSVVCFCYVHDLNNIPIDYKNFHTFVSKQTTEFILEITPNSQYHGLSI
jgi:hypothetical protein